MAKHKPLEAVLRDKRTKAFVSARVAPMAKSDVELWGLWQYPENAEDESWEWDKIFESAQKPNSDIECYAVEARNRLQGLMSLNLAGHTTPDGQALVVDYLASGPANRAVNAGLKDVGFVLLALAIQRSRDLGWGGRLWLESLPAAETFYKQCGFTKLPEESPDGHGMFWLSGADADTIWENAKTRGILNLSE